MKKAISLIIFFLIAFFSFSQSGVTFEKVCAALSKKPNTTGDFSQTKTIASSGRSLKSSGKFIFCLDGVMWKTLKPFPSSLIVSRSSITQIAPDGKKTVIDASDNSVFMSMSTMLISVFSGDLEKLYENFSVAFSASNGRWNAVLTPKDKNARALMKNLSISGGVSSDGIAFDTIVLTEEGDNKITYVFENQKYPKELSSDEKAVFAAK